MIDYRAGQWGFHVAFGINGSLAPRALVMAIPNALITFFISSNYIDTTEYNNDESKMSQLVIATASGVMLFILFNRSRTSYSRWWEGGTLLQKARGEWFNAFSSIMAFTSTKPELATQVDQYVHFTARLMSLLMCCALQQVSPTRNRPFEIIGLEGLEPASMEFLNAAPDKVEIILQWIQRSMVLQMHSGVLPAPPPILSRAFQEVSRGIVNLQNARKIADFPYPYPLAQMSMILQILHWLATPFASAKALPLIWAVLHSFCSIFVLWCIHFNALDLEFPFGTRVNDLPMNDFQQDWNKSVSTLVNRIAQRPPQFLYDPDVHDDLFTQMSDASELYVPTTMAKSNRSSASKIAIKATGRKKSWNFPHNMNPLQSINPLQGRNSVHKKLILAAGMEVSCHNSSTSRKDLSSPTHSPKQEEADGSKEYVMIQPSDSIQLRSAKSKDTLGTASSTARSSDRPYKEDSIGTFSSEPPLPPVQEECSADRLPSLRKRESDRILPPNDGFQQLANIQSSTVAVKHARASNASPRAHEATKFGMLGDERENDLVDRTSPNKRISGKGKLTQPNGIEPLVLDMNSPRSAKQSTPIKEEHHRGRNI